jgi:hypothetical protein
LCTGLVLVLPAVIVDRPAARPLRCNGFAYLCDRSLDEVVFAGTHNSMATAAAGFAEPFQGRSIREQLDAGIRALLIDLYQGTPNGVRVCTDPTRLKVDQLTQELGQQVVDLLIAARNASCPPAGSPTSALYLCHSFCELGATKFADTLAELRAFLVANPGAVVLVILEDYVDASAIDAAMTAARLQRFIFAKEPGAPWPKLRKMVSTGRRLVMFSEHQGGVPSWLLPAFAEMQDTPLTVLTTQEFSCVANRGPATAPLFLLNHWLSTPDSAATASVVNSESEVLTRAQQCARERGQMPNIIAVNFAESGGVVAAVDALNRASRGHR